MRYLFQKIGFVLLVAGVVIWLLGGAKKGFYVVTEEIPQFEVITEIEYSETHPKLIPGIESLILGAILGGSFYLTSLLFSNKL